MMPVATFLCYVYSTIVLWLKSKRIESPLAAYN